MIFNSFTFLAFFAVVLALHNLPLPWRWKKINLIGASYLFYAAWNPPFVILLWMSTITDWFVARRVDVATSQWNRRGWLGASLAVNLGLLGFFKYGTFLLDNWVALLGSLGIPFTAARPDIILPVGISFYTFQTLSYTLDIYFRRARPCNSFVDFALYVTFFPQLVAGPIVRSSQFLPQCSEPRGASIPNIAWGMMLLVIGLFQKVVVADGLLAPTVEWVYDGSWSPDTWSAWCGTLAFAGQILCDFSGYSSCAIGVAMCLGFRIPDNFRAPYAAIGFADFWRRWHISLSSWLRDYLYIPLGGNRRGARRTHVNLMLTMLIGGLWHGASWTFVFWGGLHGLYLVAERILRRVFASRVGPVGPPMRFVLMIVTFVLVCFTWVFFRAKTFENSFVVFAAMLGTTLDNARPLISTLNSWIVLLTVAAIVASHWLLRDTSLEQIVERLPWWLTALAIALMTMFIFTMPGEDRAFIYFQF